MRGHRKPAVQKRFGNGRLDVYILPANHSREHTGDENVQHGADQKGGHNPDGQVPLRLLAFLSGGRNSVKTDVRKKDIPRGGENSFRSFWGKRRKIMASRG